MASDCRGAVHVVLTDCTVDRTRSAFWPSGRLAYSWSCSPRWLFLVGCSTAKKRMEPRVCGLHLTTWPTRWCVTLRTDLRTKPVTLRTDLRTKPVTLRTDLRTKPVTLRKELRTKLLFCDIMAQMYFKIWRNHQAYFKVHLGHYVTKQ